MKYVPVEKLGAGTFGEVWKARDGDLNRWVALKFLKGATADDIVRFRREAQTAAGLVHPHIAAVYEATDEYIAMQFVEGVTLEKSREPLRERVEALRQAAAAVEFAHQCGVIHRDVKPANIMVSQGQAYVLDFGLAKTLSVASSFSISGLAVGTPSFMSPEQARGETRRVGPASDVYGLGATLYSLLSGRPPFEGRDVYRLLLSVIEEDPPRLAGCDAGLEAIAMKCLEKDASRRYATARELAEELGRWLAGEPVKAQAVSSVGRLARRLNRHRALTSGVVLCAAAVVAGAAALAMQHFSARRQIDREREVTRLREEGLQRLARRMAVISERTEELRRLTSPPEEARRALEAAVRAVDDHVAAWPEDPRGWYVRARGRLALGDAAGAEADVREALRRRADFRPGWSLLGMILMARYREARLAVLDPSHVPDALRALLDGARTAFAAGWAPGSERAESERWGLPWTRDDQVAARLVPAMLLAYHELRADDARALLRDAVRELKAPEYAMYLGLFAARAPERLEWIDQAAAWAPGDPDIFIIRADLKRQMNDLAGALADGARAVELDGRRAGCWSDLSITRAMLGDTAGAIADATRALGLSPGHFPALMNRGIARCRAGELDGALADFQEAAAVMPGSAEARYEIGVVKNAKGDFGGALEECRAALRLDPRHASARVVCGVALAGLGDRAAALAEIEEALKINADLHEAYFHRAMVRGALGDERGAVADLTLSLKINPRRAESWNERGARRHTLGDAKGAAEDLTEAIARNDRYAAAYTNRGLARMDLRDLDGAAADFDAAISIEPRVAAHRLNRGILLKTRGDSAGAERELTLAVEIDPTLFNAWFERGRVRLERRETRGATEDFTRAIEVSPKNPLAWNARAGVRKIAGDAKGAVEDYTRLIELAPTVDAFVRRAMAHRDAGDKGAAVDDLEEALRRAPEDWRFRPDVERLIRELKP